MLKTFWNCIKKIIKKIISIMGNCSGGCKPTAKILKEDVGNDMLVIQDNSNWNDDHGHDNNRQGQWKFYVNNTKVYETPMDYLFTNLTIGQDSTTKALFLPNGLQDLVDFLVAQGIVVGNTDNVGVSRCCINACKNESKDSELCDLGSLSIPQTFVFPLIVAGIIPLTAPLSTDSEETIVALNVGDPACPIDYNTYLFDLTTYGGNANEQLANESDLIARFATLNPADNAYTFNPTDCQLEVITVTPPPVITTDIPVHIPPQAITYSFSLIDENANAACPIDYANSVFNLGDFGGANGQAFADEAALLAAVTALNPAGTDTYSVNAATCAVEITSTTVPATTTGAIGVIPTPTYSFPVIDTNGDPACPIDYATAEFNLTLFGGTATEQFVDELGLIARVETLNPAGTQAYVFDGTACSLTVTSATAPAVANGAITVSTVAPSVPYTFAIEDDAGNPVCPSDYATHQFDLTDFGGSLDETFADETALINRMMLLNDAGGSAYSVDTNCDLIVTSSTPPSVTTGVVVMDTAITFSFPVVDGGTPACPIDYANTTFDLTLFNGGATESLVDEPDLIARVETLNAAGTDSYTFDATTCSVEVTSFTDPAVTSGNIEVDVTVPATTYSFPVVDGGSPACPIDYANTTFDLTLFSGGATESLADEAALIARVETLNATGTASYTFNATACAVEVSSPTAPAVTSGNIEVDVTVPATTYSFPVVDGGSPACPIDYANTTFDLTLFSGGATESLADEAALIARLETLNAAGTASYTFNATTCSVEVSSATAPAVTNANIVVVTAQTFLFPLTVNPCPHDFSVTTFDLSIFGGNNNETFFSSGALLNRISTLNPSGSGYTLDNSTCSIKTTTLTPPIVQNGNIPTAIVLVSDMSITIVPDNTNIVFGDRLNILSTVTNNGPDENTNVLVNQLLPPELFFENINSISQGTFDSATGIWSIGTIASGATVTLDILTTVNAASAIVNAEVIGDNTDTDLSNNNDLFNVGAIYLFPIAGIPCPYDFATTTFDLTNYGGGIAETFIDESALLNRMSVLNPGSNPYVFNGSNCRFELISDPAPPTLNQEITASNSDNSELGIAMSSDSNSYPANTLFLVTYSVVNNGSDLDPNCIVELSFGGGGLLVNSTTQSQGFMSLPNVWNVGSLASGSSATLEIMFFGQSPISSIDLTASVSGDNTDLIAANNTDSIIGISIT